MATVRTGRVVAATRWLRSYLVPLVLLVLVARVAFRALAGVVVPSPEFPPNNYDVVRDTIQLEWSRSQDGAKTHLEISMDDASFSGDLVVDEEIAGFTYTLDKLHPGSTYYWRVSVGDRRSTTSYFRVAADVVRF